MTRRVYVTNLKEISALRIVCTKCKAEMTVPIGEHQPPEECFSCKTSLPWQEINRTIKGIAATNKASEDSHAFEAFIETEENNDGDHLRVS